MKNFSGTVYSSEFWNFVSEDTDSLFFWGGTKRTPDDVITCPSSSDPPLMVLASAADTKLAVVETM